MNIIITLSTRKIINQRSVGIEEVSHYLSNCLNNSKLTEILLQILCKKRGNFQVSIDMSIAQEWVDDYEIKQEPLTE